MSKIKNPHDLYFRASMSDVRVALEFFKAYLPQEILKLIDLSSLKMDKNSFIDPHLKEVISDVLYRVNFKNSPGYIYTLTEHQSSVDKMMPFRVFRYMCSIMSYHVDQLKHDTLPVIVPLVFYHGKKPYNSTADIFDLFGEYRYLAEEFFLKPFKLIDANKIPDEMLKQQAWAGLFQLLQKYIHGDDLLEHLDDIASLLKKLDPFEAACYIIRSITYAMQSSGMTNYDQFKWKIIHQLPPALEEEAMTMAQQLEAKGKIEAERRIAMQMLGEGTNPAFVARVTGLSIDQVRKLAATIEEKV